MPISSSEARNKAIAAVNDSKEERTAKRSIESGGVPHAKRREGDFGGLSMAGMQVRPGP